MSQFPHRLQIRRGKSRKVPRRAAPFLVVAVLLCAQDSSRTVIYDAGGGRMEGPRMVTEKTAGGVSRSTELARDVNGRLVPRESVEERVVSQDATGTVVERVVQRYGPNGAPLTAEKVRIEQRKLPDGNLSQVETTLRQDLNGNYKVSEVVRTATETRDGQVTSNTSVERPTLSGGMDVVEKKVAVEHKAGQVTTGATTTMRRGPSGEFLTVQRQAIERIQTDGGTKETVTLFNGSGTGELQPIQQTVAITEKKPDGSATTRVDLYTRSLPGVAADGKLHLREQQLIRKVPTATGAVETVDTRLAQPDGSPPKGPYQKVIERACAGECK